MVKATSRKKKVIPEEEPTSKEHVIVQLPIQPKQTPDETPLDPTPYIPDSHFISHNDSVDVTPSTLLEKTETYEHQTPSSTNCCYWCCHSIGAKEFGMPIKYDSIHKTFTTFGHFCSLECIIAYNYDHYMGSDRMWEIHSWVQWMAHRLGYDTPIRPAPNRYLLKMFSGPLTIEEFRDVHKSYYKTLVMNMPPLIHVQGQMESINTSYLNQKTHITSTTTEEPTDKVKLTRKKAVMDSKKTLDAKMNLKVKTLT